MPLKINCAPSYTLQTGSNTTYAGTEGIEAALIAAALDQGYIVNSPDWEGPKSVFVAGIEAGQASLDSIRAASKSGSLTSISPFAKVQMWGYSGGAFASAWAAERQASYASEIPFVAMAIGGITPNVVKVFDTLNKGTFAGISAAGFLGLGNAYTDFDAYVQSSLIPERGCCFQPGWISTLTSSRDRQSSTLNPIVNTTITNRATMGRHGTPSMPIFAYKAVAGEISPIADTDALVQQFCNAGVSVTYVRDPFGEHFTQAATSTGDVLNFLADRFNGVSISGCSIRSEFLDALDPGAPGRLGVSLTQVLLNALG
ncbi:hypothetical protein AUEXF2481DRAFT_29027 [Aureobasidium subglaciale EXF-2481]|uniref:Uncharacterized protein n=1 Tax=Aureobasidium subglaciale (strain EXF-2481) TaxID=1043005 RepID=A0A074Z9Z1_AURSE|nr:uncharacterized protein AUEXF2481DRAFT_29027 [Aureobasidium subglaciale EXF-2481]KEQ95591.1 hypothetical protein AUEXF2481DRAFT_29027 [Aureobasidium subglaciale EXF-2481]